MISDLKSEEKGEEYDCISGDKYYQAIDDFQQNVNLKILDYTSEDICQVILDQKNSDQRLCNRLVKLYDVIGKSNL